LVNGPKVKQTGSHRLSDPEGGFENGMTANLSAYLSHNRERHLAELIEFLRIPSISTSSAHAADVRRAAEWLAGSLRAAGVENVQVVPTDGHPVVVGDWLHAPGRPTALIYGHYDVQPADPLEAWSSPPFEPTIRDGKIYARGATDDKAQLFMHVKAVEAFLQEAGSLPVNIKFCFEGEEEIASPNLPRFLEANRERLQADLIVISDGPMLEKGVPSICTGLRGLCGFEIEVKGPKTDLHSGLYGGGVANPLTALVQLLASLRSPDGRAAVEGFYDNVDSIGDALREAYSRIPFDEERIRRELDVPELTGEAGYSFLERTTARPTLELHGIVGGYQGEGIKTVIPSAARAKLTCRLVDRQDPDEILRLIERHVERHTPPGVTARVLPKDRGKPFVISPDHPYIQTAARAFEAGFGKAPIFVRSGGSIPIVETFSGVLEAPVVMLDFGLPGENLHAPDEHFHLEQFDRGIATLVHFWKQLP
jgi:acetylornithine deacetylase/succinyl-diaminopimelate desuccinylase-like protein